jgi:hypothetical protein
MKVSITKIVDENGGLIDAEITISKEFSETKITLLEYSWFVNSVNKIIEDG